MERAASFLAAEAKQSWHHYTITNNAEKYLARISPAHFSDGEKNFSSDNASLDNAENLTVPVSVEDVELVATTDSPDVYVKEEWEVISMDDVIEVLGGERLEEECMVLLCDERTRAKGLVRELEGQVRGVAAFAAFGRYFASNQNEVQRRVMLGTGEERSVVTREGSNERTCSDVGVVNRGEEGGVVMRIGGGESGLDNNVVLDKDMEEERSLLALKDESMAVVESIGEEGSLLVLGEEEGSLLALGNETMALGEDIEEEGSLFKGEGSSGGDPTLQEGRSEGVDSGSDVMRKEASDEGPTPTEEGPALTEEGPTPTEEGPAITDEGVVFGFETGEEEGVVGRECTGKDDGLVAGKDTGDGDVVLRDGISEEGVVLEDHARNGGVVSGASTEDHSNDQCRQGMFGVSDVREPEPIPIQVCDAGTNTRIPPEEQLPPLVCVNQASSQTPLGLEDQSRAPCEDKGTSPQPSLVCVSHASSQATLDLEDQSRPPCEDRGTSPQPSLVLMSHASSQTTLNCKDLLARAQEMKELEMLRVELHVAQSNLNTEKSQRQVSEELVKIVQTDLNSLTGKNMSELMEKVKVENQLTDVKAELSHTSRQLKESEERIQELEDILKGTTLMVRKLEEQNATTLINRGGIDYMLQARLADGRAKEAEQKLQVLQAELLQSQGEVRMLLDRVGESSRDRAEMVSSKVHTQLMAIADEKVVASERRAQIMEREILELRNRLAHYEKDLPPTLHRPGYGQSGFSGLTSSGLTGLTSYGLSGSSMLGGGVGGLGGGLTGLGGGLTGLGGPTGLGGGGLTGFGSGLTGFGSGLTGLTGAGSSYSPYSTHPSSTLSSGLGSYALQPPSLQEQYNLHTTVSSATSPSSFSPSSLLAKGVESGSHDFKLKSHDVKVAPHDKAASEINRGGGEAEVNGFTLPSFDASPVQQMGGHIPPPPSLDVAGTSHGDSDSSSWSSSDGEGEDMKPSTHSTLIAQWEWRAMKQDTPTSSNVGSTGSPSVSRNPRRPVVAPKPTARHVSIESPASFEEPTQSTTLSHVSLRKPRGPANRRVPRRWNQFPFPFN